MVTSNCTKLPFSVGVAVEVSE